ncbi:hypothetical protein RB195_026425 [Necator americanus]|uniref:Uncharacterized protein n=1 Tax=Necator americanus TaxID=51031 RepID=A0ABR1EZ92_NECAM
MKVCGILLPVLAVRVHPEQWTVISRNGEKLGHWLPNALSNGNRQRHPNICTQLLSRSRRFDWPDTIVTGDEKWVLYVNHTHTHKRAWCAGDEMPDPFVKGKIDEGKVMLSVWWGIHGIYRFELLPNNTTVTAEVYCANCKDWPTRSARSTRSSTTFVCCKITRVLTSRKRLPRKFWSFDGKFYRTHRPART